MAVHPYRRLAAPLFACAFALSACGGDGDTTSVPNTGTKAGLPALAGTLLPAIATATDSDVNDPAAPRTPNDSYAAAQRIANPVSLGGYASVDTDPDDVFAVTLEGGETLTLRIADEHADLDLYLVDAGEQVVDAALDPAARERVLTAPAAGEHYLIVRAYAGASNYLLTVDRATRIASGWHLSDPFIAGDIIFRFHGGATGSAPASLRAHARASGWLRGRGHEIGERNLLVTRSELPASHAAAPNALKHGIIDAWALDAEPRAKLDTLLALKALYHDPEVADAQPNYRYRLNTSDPMADSQWQYPLINVADAWQLTTGTDVVVAVLDSGVVLAHPDLAGQLLSGHDFMLDVPEGDDPGHSPRPSGGSAFHGTHVAGIVGALAGNGIGIAGIAHGARILPIRVCDDETCPAYAIEQGLRFAAGLPNDAGRTPARIAQVANLSFGREGGSSSREQKLFTNLHSRGIAVVAAAGNENSNARYYPAAYLNVMAVGATDARGARAPYSNYGSWIDLVAPGGDPTRDRNGDGIPDSILSTAARDSDGTVHPNYRFMYGTSVATPHVAATLALMKAVAPALTPADIAQLLQAGALTDDIGAPGRDDLFGHGQVNVYKAVLAARDFVGLPPAAAEPENSGPVDADAAEAAAPGGAHLGRQYVLLVDPGSFATRYMTVAEAQSDGSYQYRFREVVPGTYLLVAGADHDGNRRICEAGEPCGGFRALSAPVLIDVAAADIFMDPVLLQHRANPDRSYSR
ncbi:MAG: S8 family serine peptidase [Xanthomonadaceae bacterium]|nr:S8 family serine peptidase [Xanthomonadaceae bacterium]